MDIDILIGELERRLRRDGVELRGIVLREDGVDKMMLVSEGEILGVVKIREYSPAQRQN